MPRDNSIDAGAITTRLQALSDEMPLTVLVVDDDELDPELLARVHTAVTTWSLRRELRETRAALAAATGGKPFQA